jgi:hypothetical protein
MKYYVKKFNGELKLFVEGSSPDDIRFVKRSLKKGEDCCTSVCDLYWGSNDIGIVMFFAHIPACSVGFGGASFNLRMKDGSVETIKGPWSSNASSMNEYFPHCMEICFVDDCGFQLGGYCMLVEAAEPIVKNLGHDLIHPYFDEYNRYRVI